MSRLGQPVRIKSIPTLAFSIARWRSTTNKPIKPTGKNWARAFEKCRPELKARRVRSIDWKRHENNIYDKMVEWFQVIGKVLQNAAVLPENVYNMDETRVMLSKLGSVKVLAAIIRVCEESEVVKVEVPLICPSTEGVPALREGRYSTLTPINTSSTALVERVYEE